MRLLRRSGSEVAAKTGVERFRYRLFIQWEKSGNVLVRIIDNKKLAIMYEKSFILKKGRLKPQCAELINEIIKLIYKVV